MRLTSYNMAVKILSARCCLASMVERMWAYMEDGDVENADCVREKALMLSGLIKAAKRWKPTVVEGYRVVTVFDYSDVTTSTPYYQSFQRINGMVVNPPFTAFGGTEKFVDGLIQANNCFISSNDDVVQFSVKKNNNTSFTASVAISEPYDTLGNDGTIGTQTGSVAVTPVSNDEFSGGTPKCLTDAQILSVVGKIDELCGCKC